MKNPHIDAEYNPDCCRTRP